ncbi:MAG: hypothetical protein ACT4OM_09280 [Actinomycetota bacterium]
MLRDLPFEVVLALIERASQLVFENNPAAVTDMIAQCLGATAGTKPEDWTSFTQDQIRTAAAETAKIQKWFKRTDLAEALGELVAAALPAIPASGLSRTLTALADWAYAP